MNHFEVTTKAQRRKFREKKWTTESTPEVYVREAEQLIRRWLTEDMSPACDRTIAKWNAEGNADLGGRTAAGSQSKLIRWWS